MSYRREWDRGKETWNNQGDWNNFGGTHPRDQEYYGEGKRRKYNDGGYEGYEGYDNSQAYSDASYAGGYSGDSYPQGYGQGQQSGQQRGGGAAAGGYPKKRLQASEPSPHVIFLGLDPDFTEADLQAYLVSNNCSVETVTIIRERASGSSKGFGFAQFSSTEHAKAFVEPLFPFIQVPPPASHGATATTAFYKALEAGLPTNGRRVKIDYSQSASPHEKGRFQKGNVNDGTRDIGNAQGPVLLFRGLDPLSGPQAILQAMKNSSGSGREGAKGMKRIILIKDKVTMASFGFAFVEFVDNQSAAAVLGATMSPQIHPSGFRISDIPVAASFANPDSFQIVQDIMLRDEACIQSSLSLGGVEGSWVRYWDESSTVAVLEFAVAVPSKAAASAKDKKEKKKKETPIIQPIKTPAPSTLQVSDKPVTLSFNKGGSKAATIKPISLGFSSENLMDNEEDEAPANAEDDKTAAAKRVAPMIASKKIVNNISKWNQVQGELSHSSQPPATTAQPISTTSSEPGPSKASPPAPTAADEFEFSDTNAKSCLLCARQFKTIEQLQRHNRESDLHKKNLQDSNLRDVARQKVEARRAAATEQPRYRDRASERRTFFNQPDAPVPESDAAVGKAVKKRQAEGPPPRPSPPAPPVNLGQDENNVGNKLLKMMGWTEGTGLGTTGEGRVDPIKTAFYAEGAGLGASKGKDISKLTEGYSGYLSMAQDSARERYGN